MFTFTTLKDYIWEIYLRDRDAAATYWRLPCASHYPQNDQPKMIAHLVRQSLSGQGAKVSAILDSNCAPIRVEE